jgi:hypothetical protein
MFQPTQRAVSLIVCALALSASAGAQGALFGAPTLGTSGKALAVEVAHFNGDAYEDAAVGTDASRVDLFLGGPAGFSPAGSLVTANPITHIASGDFDNDGDIDLVASDSVSSLLVFIGHGDGTFTAGTGLGLGTAATDIVVGDWHGDGDLDLATSHLAGSDIKIHKGHGDCTFGTTSFINIAGDSQFSMATGDFNGNGKLDLASLSVLSAVRTFFGGGDGSFVMSTAWVGGANLQDIASCDANGDAFGDLAIANASVGVTPGNVFVLRGKANGTFSNGGTWLTGGDTHSVEAVDLDGDGLDDFATVLTSPYEAVVLHNSAGSFTVTDRVGLAALPWDVSAGDVTGDGLPDVVAANQNGSSITLLAAAADGSYSGNPSWPTDPSPNAFAAGDFDHDGLQDFAAEALSGPSVSVQLGQPDGSFTNASNDAVGAQPLAMVSADLDGDGEQDLVTANASADSVSVLLGTASGDFSPLADVPAGDDPEGLALGDFDGDGEADLAAANADANAVTILPGLGAGSFGAGTAFAVGLHPVSVAAGDLDGDGALDVVTADKLASTATILLGAGDGSFVSNGAVPVGALPFPVVQPVAVALGDLDEDGSLDIACANTDVSEVRLLLGQGDGSFVDGGSSKTGLGPDAIVVADVNADGHADVATANGTAATVTLLRGTGAGSFAAPESYASGGAAHGLLVCDLDGNSLLDLVSSGWAASATVFLNGTPTAWKDAGVGLAGVHGVPHLAAIGSLVGGSPLKLALSNARPLALCLLGVSVGSTPVPFKGGTVVTFPLLLSLGLASSQGGFVTLPAVWPTGLPSGTPLFMQYLIADPDAVKGVAISNAIKGVTP